MEKPIEIDTIQGMDTNSDEEWLNFLLRGIIKGTGFPANYIDSINEVDYAKTVIMQNALFVRALVSDQEDFEDQFTEYFRKLYINEFSDGENNNLIEEEADKLNVIFPRPKSLNLSNINDQISTASQTIDFIVTNYIDENNQDERNSQLKLEFKKNLAKDVLPSIDWNKIDNIFENTRLKVIENSLNDKVNNPNIDSSMDDMSGMDEY